MRFGATLLSVFFFLLSDPKLLGAQEVAPLNASVSGFGTSFVFGPTPICGSCVEGELGFVSIETNRYIPAVFTFAPIGNNTDITLLANVLESAGVSGNRKNRFSDRVDIIIRRRVLSKNGIVISVAPRGTIFLRDTEGGRLGTTIATQYGSGPNTGVINSSLTRKFGSPTAPAWDYQLAFDYSRLLTRSGTSVFVGIQQTASTGNPTITAAEVGLVLPIRNGQIELSSQRLDIAGQPNWMVQTRAIVNFGKVF